MLYRKYRPTRFKEVVGQEAVVRTLQNSAKAGKIAQAYLFSGPRGTGKTTVARLLAKVSTCKESESGEVCGVCTSCTTIEAGNALDIIEIDAASHTQVEKVRDLIEKVRLAPMNLTKKVYIIDEVHMLSSASFNALLKTLEEPPEHVIFIFATTEAHKIPDTIVSRTQRFDFVNVDESLIKNHLIEVAKKEKVDLKDEAASALALASEGSFRDALAMLEQVIAHTGNVIEGPDIEAALGIPEFQSVALFIKSVSGRDLKTAVQTVENLNQNGTDLTVFAKMLLSTTRKIILRKLNGDDAKGAGREDFINELAESITEERLFTLLRAFQEVASEIRRAPLPEVTLELAAHNLVGGGAPQGVRRADSPDKNPVNFSWNELLAEIKNHNASIYAFLKSSEHELTDGTLNLYFDYKFHQERIDDPKNKKLIESIAEKSYGEKINVVCMLKEKGAVKKSEDEINKEIKEDLLNSALEILGGEVVEELS